jgi:hypothetical protein
MNTLCITDIDIDFIFDGSTLTCATNSSLIVDSIELLDSDGRKITEPFKNVSSIHHNLNGEMVNSKYICRVNSTLGSQNLSINYVTKETNTNTKPSQNTPVIPIAAASAGTLLVLLSMVCILLCIILSLR